ncbi:MAG: hypothetical protein KDD45_07790 [Bdellovibrionales bacterium]|nr:hypothetical protein [Bdellovibrionales bacterium]
MPAFKVSAQAKASNNAALVYYSEEDYAMANIAKYLAMFLGVCSVIFFMIGLFGRRLICLECLAAIQVSFLSLLTLEDLSPSFSSLEFLRYSMGYNSLKSYDLEQDVDRPFKSAEFNQQ